VRILDKYLLREFAWPLLYCFDAFALLWIVGDLFNHLDDFIEARAPLSTVGRYYLTVFPEAFVQFLPMALLLGLLFCLANLARHNELTAMRAGGLSRARLMVPFLAIGLAATAVVGLVNELFVPGSQARGKELLAGLRGAHRATGVIQNFFYADPAANFYLYARAFHPDTGQMTNPEIHEQHPDGTPRRDLYAERAVWRNGAWWLFTVRVDDRGPSSPAPAVAELSFPALREPPARLALAAREPREMTTTELQRFIRAKRRSHDVAKLPAYAVAFHERFAFPWTCFLVVWVGIPLGMQIGRGGALRSVGVALGLVVAFYFLTIIARGLGSNGWLSPVWAAWGTPALLFGAGAILLRRLP
jgi:lipopolysaccharide export system permease protein